MYHFETSNQNIIEMYEDYHYLKYYKTFVLNELQDVFYSKFTSSDYLPLLNPAELKTYLSILTKYLKSNTGSIYTSIYNAKEYDLIVGVIDTSLIDVFISNLKHDIINECKKE